jgi:hypothetical protein
MFIANRPTIDFRFSDRIRQFGTDFVPSFRVLSSFRNASGRFSVGHHQPPPPAVIVESACCQKVPANQNQRPRRNNRDACGEDRPPLGRVEHLDGSEGHPQLMNRRQSFLIA